MQNICTEYIKVLPLQCVFHGIDLRLTGLVCRETNQFFLYLFLMHAFSVYLIKFFHVNFLWRDNESRMNECFFAL